MSVLLRSLRLGDLRVYVLFLRLATPIPNSNGSAPGGGMGSLFARAPVDDDLHQILDVDGAIAVDVGRA